MKIKKKYAAKSSPSKNDNFEKIELVRCPRGGKNCSSQLSDINKIYLESNNYKHNKEYRMSIESLKHAFDKTYELKESECEKCARIFRSTIIDSLENMHVELGKISSGYFRSKRFKGSYLMAEKTLQTLKKHN
ncbi:MAG: hypothetical protein ACOC1D_00285 [Prolixibacteraceae bacterium]